MPIKKLRSTDLPKDTDCISSLPESITCHILSCLTAKEAVRTCVLSKDWERKWTSIYNISIDDSELCQERSSKFFSLNSTKSNFFNFVDRLLLVSQNVKSFCLSCLEEHESIRFSSWISAILRRKVENLEVVYAHEGITLPQRLLSCTSLGKLKLKLCCTFIVPVESCLPRLTVLCLQKVKVQNENPQADTLTFTFPMLETFELQECTWLNVKLVDIYAPKLTTFKCKSSIHAMVNDHSIKVTAERVAKFESYGGVPEHVIITGSLTYAVLENFVDSRDNQIFAQMRTQLRKLLKGISSSQHLVLSDYLAKLLHAKALSHLKLEVSLPQCHKLEQRFLSSQLGVSGQIVMSYLFGELSTGGVGGIVELLNAATFLKYLSVDLKYWYDYDYDRVKPIPRSLVFCLEEVKINNFGGTTSQLNFAKFVLKNGSVLKKVHVSFDRCYYAHSFSSLKERVAEQLSTCPKSSACLLVLVN